MITHPTRAKTVEKDELKDEFKKRGVIISALGEKSFSNKQVDKINTVLNAQFHAQLNEMDKENFIRLCQDAEILGITRRPLKKLEKDTITALPNLKGIAIYTTGYDWIDVKCLHERKITLSYLPDYATITVAEHTLALMLTMSRRSHLSFDKVRGFISDDISLRGWELWQKSVGIVGFGKIGQEIAKLSKAFGMTVTFYDNKVSQFDANYQPFEDLLRYSDVIVLAASKIRNASPIIGKHEIALMKKEAYLINPSRADLVDNAEMLKAIQNHQLSGYAVDDKIDLFLNASIEAGRILQTGHTAWYSTEAIARGTQNWVENIISLASQPQNVVTI